MPTQGRLRWRNVELRSENLEVRTLGMPFCFRRAPLARPGGLLQSQSTAPHQSSPRGGHRRGRRRCLHGAAPRRPCGGHLTPSVAPPQGNAQSLGRGRFWAPVKSRYTTARDRRLGRPLRQLRCRPAAQILRTLRREAHHDARLLDRAFRRDPSRDAHAFRHQLASCPEAPRRSAARSLALVVLFLPILRAYRLLLFFVTLKTMH